MERDHEIGRLVRVMRCTAKMAMRLARSESDQEVGAFCAGQYNRILARLKELDPQLAPFFQSLPENSSANVAAMASRLLVAYFDEGSRPFERRAREQRRERRHARRQHLYRCGLGFARF
ncbi:MAG TPA: hypothetical protein VLZ81_13660 [Blastocatellia bacterium]|nr:hypothetical protein [Blastocatellia bacterium]